MAKKNRRISHEELPPVIPKKETNVATLGAVPTEALAHASRHRYASALNCCREVVRSARCKEAGAL